MQRAKRPVMATVLATSLMLAGMAPVSAGAEGNQDQLVINKRPTELAMLGDVLFARPFLIASTVVGLTAFTVTLPFSVMGGNEHEAAETLVAKPARASFLRCLGCTPRQDERLKTEERTARINEEKQQNRDK